MISLFMELLHNHSFTLTNGTDPKKGYYALEVVSSMDRYWHLFSSTFRHVTFLEYHCEEIYRIYTVQRAIHKALKERLSQDLAASSTYFQNWKLKLSITKIGSGFFYLTNREMYRELNFFDECQTISFCAEPTYLV